MSKEVSVFGLLDVESQTVSSLLVAEKFGKRHSHLLRDIESKILPNLSVGFAEPNFGLCFKINELQNGKKQKYYNLTKDGFMMAVMSMTGKEAYAWKEAFIKEFNRIEEENRVLQGIVWQVINGKNYLPQELGAQAAGIERPRLFMRYIKEREDVLTAFMDRGYLEHKRVGKTAQDKAWRWSQAGFQYILKNRDKLNSRVKEIHNQVRKGIIAF